MNKTLSKKIEFAKIKIRIMKILENGNARTAKDIAEILDINISVATQHCCALLKLGQINSFYSSTPVWFIGEQLEVKKFKEVKEAKKANSDNIKIKMDDEFDEWFEKVQSSVKNKETVRELALKTGI